MISIRFTFSREETIYSKVEKEELKKKKVYIQQQPKIVMRRRIRIQDIRKV